MKLITIFAVVLPIFFGGCGERRTYLKDFEKAWNPYKNGQSLIFRSADEQEDTVLIIAVMDKRFADGIGAPKNERLRVLARHKQKVEKKTIELSFLYLTAETPKDSTEIDFEFFLDGDTFWGRGYRLSELYRLPEFSIETEYGKFNDVIKIEDNSNRPFAKQDIQTLYWSKSAGYVKYDNKDGTHGELFAVK